MLPTAFPPWMYYENWIQRCRCSVLLPIFPSGHLQCCNEKSLAAQKAFSLYCILLSHGGLIFVKHFQSPEKSFFLNDVTTVALRLLITSNSIGLNRHHLGIRYPDNIIQLCFPLFSSATALTATTLPNISSMILHHIYRDMLHNV